jgi:small subunit ribosomal protein S17
MKKSEQIGTVISKKTNKTIIVRLQKRIQHSLYKKIITKTTHFLVNDEKNCCNIGNIVLIKKITPVSKKKYWTVKDILKKY